MNFLTNDMKCILLNFIIYKGKVWLACFLSKLELVCVYALELGPLIISPGDTLK